MSTIEKHIAASVENRVYDAWHTIRSQDSQRVAYVRMPMPKGIDVDEFITVDLPSRPEVESVVDMGADAFCHWWTVYFHPYKGDGEAA